MESERVPPGKRLKRLSLSLLTPKAHNDPGSNQIERCEFTIGPTASGEEVVSLWCDISSEYVTITMVVNPPGARLDLVNAAAELISWTKTTGPNRKTTKGKRISPSEELNAAECAKGDEILSRMWNHVEGMEHRQVIYKVMEITGAIEWTVYIPPSEKPPPLKPHKA
ncbi:hypothetical protein [Pseudomonas chlororaphis]|uniref:hypothetical protein n=1 Tax=Pseudomonas chlororaphis TaxID=587753 RepID=UPI000F584703|nr:hypothetical protein [Pseudomonas chlororaphis]